CRAGVRSVLPSWDGSDMPSCDIVPVDVESLLHARLQEERDPSLSADLLRLPSQQLRGARHNIAGGVGEEVEGVLDAPSSFQRTRIDRNAEGLLERARVELPRAAPQCNGSFQQSAIEIRADQTLPELLQRS